MTPRTDHGASGRKPFGALALGALVALTISLAISGWLVFVGPAEVGRVSGIGGPFRLVDGQGRTVTDADLRGRAALIYFGYTSCPDVCPTALSDMLAAVDALGADAGHVRPVFISIDPQRDTPAIVGEYVAAFSPRLLGLTGSPDAIAAAAKAYRVYYAPHSSGEHSGGYTVDHSSIVYMIDAHGAFRAVIRTGQPAMAMAAEIRANL